MSEDFVLRTSYEGQLAAEIFVLLFLGSTTSREQSTTLGCSVQPPLEL